MTTFSFFVQLFPFILTLLQIQLAINIAVDKVIWNFCILLLPLCYRQQQSSFINYINNHRQMQQSDTVEQLISKLIIRETANCQLLPNTRNPSVEANKQVEELDISDYLQLLAHQKKHINAGRLRKLRKINLSGMMEQQDYKYFLAVASQAHYRRLEHPGYYKLLLSKRETYPPIFFSSIDKDVPRTLPPGHAFSEQLRNVLTAYAIRNPSLAYCQGMNYLVGYLLINQMSSEQTFWVLACLIENCLPDDYFKDLTTISILSCIFDQLLEHTVPEFKNLLAEAGMDCSALLVPWLVCLFSKNFINSVSAYLLGYFMLETQQKRPGYVLLKIAIGIISAVLMKNEELPFSKDFKTIKDYLELRVFELSLTQIRDVLETVELKYEVYCQLEDYYRREKEEARASMLLSKSSKKMTLPPCNPDYPVCLHRIEIEKKLGAIENTLIFKNGLTLKQQMVEDYLNLPQDQQVPNVSYLNFEQCEIGRQEHVCHLNENESRSKVDVRGKTLERDVTHQVTIIDSDKEESEEEVPPEMEESIEQKLRLSTCEERFREVTEYFVIDEQFGDEDAEDRKCEMELQKEFAQFNREKSQSLKEMPDAERKIYSIQNQKDPNKEKGFKFYLNSVIKKATGAINQLQKVRKGRRSRQSGHSIEVDPYETQSEPDSKNRK